MTPRECMFSKARTSCAPKNFTEFHFFLQKLVQVAARAILENEAQVILRLEGALVVDDKWALLEFLEDLLFVLNVRFCRFFSDGFFVDDLQGVHLFVLVLTGEEDLREGSLADH